MLACQQGHYSIAILLLEKGANKQLHNKVSLYKMYKMHKIMIYIIYYLKSSIISIMMQLWIRVLKWIHFTIIISPGNKILYLILYVNKAH